MKREAICTGKTLEEALEKAYAELGVTSENSDVEILERPKKSFFGLKVTLAKVKVTAQEEEPQAVHQAPKKERPAPVSREQQRQPKKEERREKPAEAKPQAEPKEAKEPTESDKMKVECAVAYLKDIFVQMGLDQVEVKASLTGNGAVLALGGEGLGVLIGRRGETLDALQYLTGLVANRLEGDYFRITIDSGNYREKREKTLEQLAKKLSNQVLKNGRSMTLEPMNPYERRIIHATVQNIEGVTSSSIGEEPNRRVVISSTSPRKKYPPKNKDAAGKGGRRSGSGQNRGGGGRREGGRPPREFKRGGGTPITTRDNAFGDSRPKRIDDSAYEIEPPVRAAQPVRPAEKPPVKRDAPEATKDQPLYSKIDVD